MQGKIREKITEDQLKGLLEQISEQSVCVIYICVCVCGMHTTLLSLESRKRACAVLAWIQPNLVCDTHLSLLLMLLRRVMLPLHMI